MLQVATSLHRDVVEGRWVIVEPDVEATILVVITAYQAD
jgi:hypothetical protein